MNKKAGLIGFMFFMLAFWVVWIFFISPFVNAQVSIAVDAGNLSGFEQFVLVNLIYIIGLASLALFFMVARGGGD